MYKLRQLYLMEAVPAPNCEDRSPAGHVSAADGLCGETRYVKLGKDRAAGAATLPCSDYLTTGTISIASWTSSEPS